MGRHNKINTRTISLMSVLAVFATLLFALLFSPSAFAAYPEDFCDFSQPKTSGSIFATCSDDASNGGFHGAEFKREDRGNTYAYSQNYRNTSPSSGTVTDEDTCKATITLTKSTEAKISGEYRTKSGSRYDCTALKAESIEITRGGQRDNIWWQRLVDNLASNIIEDVCKKNKQQCRSKVQAAAAKCLTQANPRFPFAPNEGSRSATVTALKSCLNKELSSPGGNKATNAQVNSSVNRTVQGADSAADDESLEDIPDADKEKDEEDEVSCNIEQIGWIICPIVDFMGKLNDKAFNFIENWLEVDADLFTSTGTYNAWKAFRDIANVAFVAAFLVIVYSQLTSMGISNYGIKRMLPRLFIAAILVNVSFWICAFAADISNILGSSMYTLFESINIGKTGESGGTWEETIGPILVAGIGIALLAAFVISIPALIAFALVMLILVGRQAFIILLIVIAPLAFVAYLLPNTEQWFKKWWKMFYTLLAVYPIVGIVFGASKLASDILLNINSGGDVDKTLGIVALGVLAIPLFAIPIILKGALGAAGAVGQRLSSAADKAQGAASKKSKERFDNSAYARGKAQRKEARNRFKREKFAAAVTGDDTSLLGRARARAAKGALGRGVTPAEKYAQAKLGTDAIFEADKAFEDAVKGESIKQIGMSNREVSAVAASGMIDGRVATKEEYTAALDRTMKSGSFKERNAALSYMAEHKEADTKSNPELAFATESTMRQRAVQAAYAKGDQAIYGSDFGNEIVEDTQRDASGNIVKGTINSRDDLKRHTIKTAEKGKHTGESIVQSGGATEYLVDTVNDTSFGTQTARDNVKDAARNAQTSQGTAGRYSTEIQGHVSRIR